MTLLRHQDIYISSSDQKAPQIFRNLTEALFQASATSVLPEIRLFWAHCCNILYHSNITVNTRFIPAFVRPGSSFQLKDTVLTLHWVSLAWRNLVSLCSTRSRCVMKGDQNLWSTPSADGQSMCRDESWEKKPPPSNSALPSCCWFPANHSTLQPGNHWVVTLKQKVFCGPPGQPDVLCIILQGCAAGKALTIEAADYLDVN